MVDFYCDNCNKFLSVPDNQAGGKGRCPKCQQELDVPTPVVFNCTKCGIRISLAATMIGQKVRCSDCNGHNIVPEHAETFTEPTADLSHNTQGRRSRRAVNAMASNTDRPGGVLSTIICPNCWHRFPPEQILFIARHQDLIGDELLGQASYRRFLPTRYNVAGDALDARGMACQELACPRCHLQITRPLIELPPVFISIVGAPASGKSYLLAAMTWALRQLAPKLGFVLTDGHPRANLQLQANEELLFMSSTPEIPVALEKTVTAGSQLYQTTTIEGQQLTFPQPFQFTITPNRSDRDMPVEDFPYCTLVLYDNAGEHFLPGADTTGSPVTLHLAESAVNFFVFDPTQDPRFRALCHKDDPQLKYGSRPESGVSISRQEAILNEMAARVRQYKGLSQSSQHHCPLVMIIAKSDLWMDDEQINEMSDEPIIYGNPTRLDMASIERVSDKVRHLMKETCPEMVSAAESFSRHVVYIPVSSMGTSPEVIKQQDAEDFYGIRPKDMTPKWVTAPALWTLSRLLPGLMQNGPAVTAE